MSDPDTTDIQAVVDEHGAVLLFDGVCNLCNGLVQEIIRRDPRGRVSFAPLQSPFGRAVRERYGLSTDDLDSAIVVDHAGVHTKSDAVIRVLELLGWPYRLAGLGNLLPRGLRNGLYDVVAATRYDVFGKKDQCMVPTEDVSSRFVTD